MREGSEFALSGVRTPSSGPSSFFFGRRGGGVARVKGVVFRGCCCVVGRQRVQFLRASERDEQGGACCLSVFRSGMVLF